jgi:DNA-binding beta-propeller fold protein YncE
MTAVGPMRRPTGQVMGWTGDLVRIDGRVYGIDVGARHVYVADLETGMCLPVTPQLGDPWRGLQGLAYDAEDDHLYAVDQGSGALVEITRGTGNVRRIEARDLAGRKGVRSLAFEPDVRLLFAADSDADLLLVIDPETGWLADTMSLPDDQAGHIEELTFFEGELYAMVAMPDAAGALTRGQLRRIDLRTGFVSSVGEPIADVSPHALLIESVPEQFYWAQVAGPAVAPLDYTTLLETSASFPQPGRYEFALTVLTREGPMVDRVAVTVVEPARE